MIGVAIQDDEIEPAAEFFELFKTPWERVVAGRRYPAVITTTGAVDGAVADVILAYGCRSIAIDEQQGRRVRHVGSEGAIWWGDAAIPVYRGRGLFEAADPVLRSEGQAVAEAFTCAGARGWRIGYDLFAEAAHLLGHGQPAAWARTPTFERHIALLRHLLLEAGAGFVEIAPRPAGYAFTCCLTHDLDFFGVARHGLDRTMAGFLWRASAGSMAGLLRGRRNLREAATNWAALLSLVPVRLGWTADFWHPVRQYAEADSPHPSTYFVVPFRQRPGRSLSGGTAPSSRGVPYQASDVAGDLAAAAAAGSEVAVHGIDAWCSSDAGRRELKEITAITGTSAGVRMHWLYYAQDTPRLLEEAGFAYDSSCGYNDEVGYRAGTSQVFRCPGTAQLLQLPLCVMDSALFFPNRLGLSFARARAVVRSLIATASALGGTMVVNWHDRSLAPERLWTRPYRWLLDDVRQAGRVWFATAGAAVDWFRARRAVSFRRESATAVTVVPPSRRDGLPGLLLRIHRPGGVPIEERELAGPVSVAI